MITKNQSPRQEILGDYDFHSCHIIATYYLKHPVFMKKRFELYAKKQEIKAHIQDENRNILFRSPDFKLTKDFKLSIII